MSAKDFERDYIRQHIINHLDCIKDLLITDQQLKIIRVVSRFKEVDAQLLAETLNISVNSASTRLKRLYDKGYLMRYQQDSKTGGIEYVYYTLYR